MRRVQFATVVLFLGFASSGPPVAESQDECKDVELQRAWDDASSPVYLDAEQLSLTLNDRGFGRYIYSFRGRPRIVTRIDSAKSVSFIMHGNLMLEVWGDKQLAETLEVAFRTP
jgi:hypothetical protein